MNEVIEAIRNLFKTSLGSDYKKVYYGEIRVPNQLFLPFIEVIPVGSKVINRGTGGMLGNEYQIQVNVKSTLKKYLGKTNNKTLEHIKDLVERIEWRDPDGNLDSNTVLGVLHNNLQLSNTANINGDWEIAYGEMDLGESFITVATITFTVKVITV